jgi:uncharacterized protein YdhG (YjbR/CyaY superfamily)
LVEFEEFLGKMDNPDQRARAEEVFDWVAKTFPTLVPKIAWNQPMFTDNDTCIIGFSVSKQHLAVAPERAGMIFLTDEIVKSGYAHTNLLVRIPWKSPVDYSLLKKMIAFNMEDKADCTTFWRK